MPWKYLRQYQIIFVLFLFLIIISSGCVELKTAYIEPDKLPPGWIEVTALKNTVIESFGFEKWSSVTYEYQEILKGILTISTINTLVLTDENDLLHYVNSTVYSIFENHGNLSLMHQGSRSLLTKHTSQYIIYQLHNKSTNITGLIIGEVWNCGIAGASIMCMGFVIDENSTNQSLENSDIWLQIVGDPFGNIDGKLYEGLIYQVKCH